jgi:hypothetical protein
MLLSSEPGPAGSAFALNLAPFRIVLPDDRVEGAVKADF